MLLQEKELCLLIFLSPVFLKNPSLRFQFAAPDLFQPRQGKERDSQELRIWPWTLQLGKAVLLIPESTAPCPEGRGISDLFAFRSHRWWSESWKCPAGLAILSAHHGNFISFPLLVSDSNTTPISWGVGSHRTRGLTLCKVGRGLFSNLWLYTKVSDSILKEPCDALSTTVFGYLYDPGVRPRWIKGLKQWQADCAQLLPHSSLF